VPLRRLPPAGIDSREWKWIRAAAAVWIAACIVAVPPLRTSRVDAAELQIEPSLSLTGEYNDNIFFSSEEEADLITTLSPGLDLLRRSERFSGKLSGRLGIFHYLDNDDLDAVDQDYGGRMSYRFADRTRARLWAGYVQDNRPDRDIEETGLVQGNEQRERIDFGAGGVYQTSETGFADLSYRYENTDYEGPEFADSSIHTLNLLQYWSGAAGSRRWQPRLGLGYARGDFETSTVDTMSGTVGGRWDASELLWLQADFGVRYTRTDFQSVSLQPPGVIVATEEISRDWSGVVDLTAVYTVERSSLRVGFVHDLRNAPGRGGTVQRTELKTLLEHRFTERLRGDLDLRYIINSGEQGTVTVVETDNRSLRIQPSLAFDLDRHWSFEALYRFVLVDDRVDDSRADQNVFFARIRWRWPLLEP